MIDDLVVLTCFAVLELHFWFTTFEFTFMDRRGEPGIISGRLGITVLDHNIDFTFMDRCGEPGITSKRLDNTNNIDMDRFTKKFKWRRFPVAISSQNFNN